MLLTPLRIDSRPSPPPFPFPAADCCPGTAPGATDRGVDVANDKD